MTGALFFPVEKRRSAIWGVQAQLISLSFSPSFSLSKQLTCGWIQRRIEVDVRVTQGAARDGVAADTNRRNGADLEDFFSKRNIFLSFEFLEKNCERME